MIVAARPDAAGAGSTKAVALLASRRAQAAATRQQQRRRRGAIVWLVDGRGPMYRTRSSVRWTAWWQPVGV